MPCFLQGPLSPAQRWFQQGLVGFVTPWQHPGSTPQGADPAVAPPGRGLLCPLCSHFHMPPQWGLSAAAQSCGLEAVAVRVSPAGVQCGSSELPAGEMPAPPPCPRVPGCASLPKAGRWHRPACLALSRDSRPKQESIIEVFRSKDLKGDGAETKSFHPLVPSVAAGARWAAARRLPPYELPHLWAVVRSREEHRVGVASSRGHGPSGL